MKGDDNVKEIMKWHDQSINPDPDHSSITCTYNYATINFFSQVMFVFLLFLSMEMYANEVETKEKEKLPEIKK